MFFGACNLVHVTSNNGRRLGEGQRIRDDALGDVTDNEEKEGVCRNDATSWRRRRRRAFSSVCCVGTSGSCTLFSFKRVTTRRGRKVTPKMGAGSRRSGAAAEKGLGYFGSGSRVRRSCSFSDFQGSTGARTLSISSRFKAGNQSLAVARIRVRASRSSAMSQAAHR